MSRRDLWTVLGRFHADPAFRDQLGTNAESALTQEGYQLDDGERALLQQSIVGQTELNLQQADMHKRLTANTDRGIDLGKYTVSILKTTLNNAARTYRAISFMYKVMFTVGITLFVGAAIYGAVSGDEVISFVFAGLGAVTFVATFLTGPIEKSQTALSNLVQAEIAFMNFFEQITFWEGYALAQSSEDPAKVVEKIDKASAMLQKRSMETVALLQRYLEREAPDTPA